ncbi:cobalamin-binding protein [Shewanella sp. 5_MG-2023]|uniref:cobalamin-binding protein n=1 Tax=unclassified Shewanella TaxID=196818 RepID=UPI000C838B45|nr:MULTISPECIES: cobalamin-binding protein [unclassified Shewanella]MDO6639651.1 cobalamin-binding protein [Shewanella sp. 5_MG-2023]MDO6677727.1 cobalamin-binding protein [Shewanella sp. 4_MG-2023]MDO6777090.1 cobalamin-binding protein [Shewanella sp. 3_MG-2023]PMI00009.1 cobalamin-binding protein [Shewanella sp. 10N.286.48.A6]
MLSRISISIFFIITTVVSPFLDAKTKEAEPAKRIIALSPHAVEMLYAIGAGESIVATTDHTDFPEAAKSIPSIGGYYGIQIERVLELNPDLIVVWNSGNKMDDITQLTQLGFKVFNSDPKSLDDVANELEQLGELTGNQDKAAKVAANYRQQLTDIRAENQLKSPVKVFYQLWSTPLMTVSKGSWIEHIIEACHGENVFIDAASEYPQVSVENVLLTMAEVILQSQDEGNVIGVDWSQWPELPAVKNQHIYQLNADVLHRASPRAILGVEALCSALDKVRQP